MKRYRVILALPLAAVVATAVWAADNANKVGGGYIVYPNKQGTVAFSHLAHANAGFKCTDCHPAVVAMKKGNVKMDEITAGKQCGKCHDGQTKGPKSGEAAFEVKNCTGCHMPDKDITLKTKGPGPVTFSHAKHLGTTDGETGGQACGDCHPKLFAQKAGESIGMKFPHRTGCGTCHDGKTISPSGAKPKPFMGNCKMCHKSD